MTTIPGVPVPAGVVHSGRFEYTLSWELYRALEGKQYSGADQLADQSYEEVQKVQTLWWDNQGFGHVALQSRKQREIFERNRKIQQDKRFRELAWFNYEQLQRESAFNREVCDKLLEMRKHLEELGDG